MGYWRLRVAFPLKVAWLLEEPPCEAAECFVSLLLCHPHTKQTRRPHIPEILHTNPESAFLNQPRSCKSSGRLYVWKQMNRVRNSNYGRVLITLSLLLTLRPLCCVSVHFACHFLTLSEYVQLLWTSFHFSFPYDRFGCIKALNF